MAEMVDMVGKGHVKGGVQHVNIQVRKDPKGYSIWVNADGMCRFRAKAVPSVDVDTVYPTDAETTTVKRYRPQKKSRKGSSESPES